MEKAGEISKAELAYVKEVFEHIREYDFASAVHALEKIFCTYNIPTFGNSISQNGDSLRIKFRATVRHAPSATMLDHVEVRDGVPVLWVNFTGIAGIQGPLPRVYTERVFRNMRNKDYAFASFLDIFNNRIAQLTYDLQQWIPGVSADSPEKSQIGQVILALGGIDPFVKYVEKKTHDENFLQINCIIPGARYLITYKTLFMRKVRSAAALKQILQNFFKVKADIIEYDGSWLPLRKSDVPKLGTSYTLGKDTFLGDRVWRYNKIVKIVLSDIPELLYDSFNHHAGAPNWVHLQQLATMFLPAMVKIKYLVQIRADGKKGMRIGHPHNLGFNTWLGNSSSIN